MAARFNCLVTIGYPEKTRDYSIIPSKVPHAISTAINSLLPESKVNAPEAEETNEYVTRFNFNSTITIGADGAIVAHYRKSFLYYADATWASPSPIGFTTVSLPLSRPTLPDVMSEQILAAESLDKFCGQSGDSRSASENMLTATFAICMDINNEFFTAPWEKRELATHALESGTSILIMSTAWLTRLPCVLDDPGSSVTDTQISDRLAADPRLSYPCCSVLTEEEPDMDTFRYWLNRLEPLIRAERSTIVIIANRAGLEPGAVNACDLAAIKPPGLKCPLGSVTLNENEKISAEKVEQNHVGSEPTAQLVREVKRDGERGVVSALAHYAGSSTIMILGHNQIRRWGILGRGEEKVLVADLEGKEESIWVLT